MTYRPGRYRAGGRHEDEEEVRREKEEERIPSDFDLGFGERRKRTFRRSSERREMRESRIKL